jgi:hypothetical protein
MVSKLLLAAGIMLAPALCLAQSAPGLYIGASASMLSSRPFRSYNTNTYSPAVTVGYQLSPRWAIQSGASLSWNNSKIANSEFPSSSIFENIQYEIHYRRLTVPLLARYTFTDPAKPLHIDALVGGSWIHSFGNDITTYTYRTLPSDVLDSRYNYNDASLGIGPSVRYTLGANLDVTASSLLQTDITHGRAFDYYYLTTQLGIQYAFGR